jgi:hypothetical protein
MLAGPPADAMTYVNPSRGLDPSLYGGGGSPSSRSLLADSLVSCGSAAFVSAKTLEAAPDEDGSWPGATVENAGRGSSCSAALDVALLALATAARSGLLKKREKKEGGPGSSAELEDSGWM